MSAISRGLHRVAGFDGYLQCKAPGMEGHLTLGELAKRVSRDKKRIVQLEREGRIPRPVTVQHGQHAVRLYNKKQVEEVVAFFRAIDARRPHKSGPKRGRNYRCHCGRTNPGGCDVTYGACAWNPPR